jgi:hypothetical protein
MQSISKRNEQIILNLELVLFCLKHKASTTQLSITDCFWKSNLHTGINVTFYLFIIFVGLSKKFIIVIFMLPCCVLHTF